MDNDTDLQRGMTLKLPASTWDRLARQAGAAGITVNELIARLVLADGPRDVVHFGPVGDTVVATRVGVGIVTSDGSVELRLSALPADGRLVLMGGRHG